MTLLFISLWLLTGIIIVIGFWYYETNGDEVFFGSSDDKKENLWLATIFAGLTILWPLSLILFVCLSIGVFLRADIRTHVKNLLEKHIFDIYEYSQTHNEKKIEDFVECIFENKDYKSFLELKMSRKILLNFSTPLNPRIQIIIKNRVKYPSIINGKHIQINFK